MVIVKPFTWHVIVAFLKVRIIDGYIFILFFFFFFFIKIIYTSNQKFDYQNLDVGYLKYNFRTLAISYMNSCSALQDIPIWNSL